MAAEQPPSTTAWRLARVAQQAAKLRDKTHPALPRYYTWWRVMR